MGGALTEVFTFPTSAFLVGELTLAQVMCVCVGGGGGGLLIWALRTFKCVLFFASWSDLVS